MALRVPPFGVKGLAKQRVVTMPDPPSQAVGSATMASLPFEMHAMTALKKVILFTDTDGHARFRDETLELTEGTPQSQLSQLMSSSGYQLRQSPLGFRSSFHCTGNPQYLFVLSGQMEIFLQDGSSRVFGPGEFFYSNDTLPEGATFDPSVHGHWSRQIGPDPLVTLFVRD